MKRCGLKIAKKLSYILALSGICLAGLRAEGDKLTPADLIAKHLESIGTAEARALVKGSRVTGTCLLTVRQGGTGQDSGQVLIASHGHQNMIQLTFETATSSSWMKFDGRDARVSQFRPGSRTALENFFASHDEILKEGLFGGTLSASWSLLEVEQRNPKLQYAGVKKVDGRQLHALKYGLRKGSDLKVVLYFDSDTFRHLRTEYERTIYVTDQQRIPGGGGSLPSIGTRRATGARINASEDFSDFRSEGGLNLPHTYKFELSIQSEVRPALIEWTFNLTDFTFNPSFDAREFSGPGS